jgi:CRP-like cAMP-binding protein
MITPEAQTSDELPNPSAPSYIASMTRTYQAGEVLFQEGDLGREMFIVLKGAVRIARASGDARVRLGEFKEGEFFGEMALVGSGVRTGTATVQVDQTELVAVNQARFVYLVSQQPAFALSVMRLMGRRVEAMNQRLSDLGMQVLEGATQ